jgi:hypothetical protein
MGARHKLVPPVFVGGSARAQITERVPTVPAIANKGSAESVARYRRAVVAAAMARAMSLIRNIPSVIAKKDTQETFAKTYLATGILSSKFRNRVAMRISCHSVACAAPKAPVFATQTTRGCTVRSLRASSATPWTNAPTGATETACARSASASATLVLRARIVVQRGILR